MKIMFINFALICILENTPLIEHLSKKYILCSYITIRVTRAIIQPSIFYENDRAFRCRKFRRFLVKSINPLNQRIDNQFN
jgi:hypothetical protein